MCQQFLFTAQCTWRDMTYSVYSFTADKLGKE